MESVKKLTEPEKLKQLKDYKMDKEVWNEFKSEVISDVKANKGKIALGSLVALFLADQYANGGAVTDIIGNKIGSAVNSIKAKI